MPEQYSKSEVSWLTFLIYPFHGEKLFIVERTHVSNLTAKPFKGDGRFKMCYHDISEKQTKLEIG